MKFYNYINEQTDINDIIIKIEKDCKPFINNWDRSNIDSFLYSGRKIDIDFITKKQVRRDRRPLDTPLELHKFVDNWFNKKFGVKARSNSVFASFNRFDADYYGTPYLLFPIGKYTIIGDPNIKDFYRIYNKVFKTIDSLKSNYGIWYANEDWYDLNEDEKELYKKELLEYLNKNTNFKKGLSKSLLTSELMITCKEYYLINSKYEVELLGYFKG